MNEQKFDELWSRAEAEGYASRLASEYSGWRSKTRRTIGMVTGLVLVFAIAMPIMMPEKASDNSSHAKVLCNRTGIVDQQWIDLADNLLLG